MNLNKFIWVILISASAVAEPNVPEGMKKIQSGSFWMGRDHSQRSDETPRHRVDVSEFYIDETLVTYRSFETFVQKTNYVTTAEKKGYGMVAIEGMPNWKWKKVPGASWKQPFGSELANKLPMKGDFPVVSVSWEDANHYCVTQGKRLPTEAEWEYAARAGGTGTFPWGESPKRNTGKLGLNFWQGPMHEHNEKTDGYIYMSPVKAFEPNAWGIYDPVGNVWQWVSDWYATDYYEQLVKDKISKDPKGPTSGKWRVARGGSWWCSSTTCAGYGLYFRGKGLPTSVFNNNGFRCAMTIPNL